MERNIEQFVIDKVREIRQQRGISQAELADRIDVSRGFIGAVENPHQRAKYNLSILNEIAKVMDCSIRDFFPDKYL
ncbi:MAG: helix-turn-helix transcriptional regulator [Bacteroidota bacterium]|nr:helix-turn-helix transcriptional regulator [Bacteroidota bacterium]